jgi:SAM-dependent methyltransferase
MNSLLKNNFLIERPVLLDKIMSIENRVHEKNKDNYIKWVGIIEAYEALGINAKALLEVGCGVGSLCIYFKKSIPIVIGVDPAPHFDPHKADYYKKGIVNYVSNGVTYIDKDILDVDIPYNSIDVVIDSCAMGCGIVGDKKEKTIEKIYNILIPGGYFITVGDTCLTVTDSKEQFMSPATWIKAANKYKLKLVGEYSEVSDNIFTSTYGVYTLNIVRLVFQKPFTI